MVGGVEVISVDVVAGKTLKKRTFEKVSFEVPVFPDNPLFLPDDTKDDTPPATVSKGPSRSVSVCLPLNSGSFFLQPLVCRRKSKNGYLTVKNSWTNFFAWRVAAETRLRNLVPHVISRPSIVARIASVER